MPALQFKEEIVKTIYKYELEVKDIQRIFLPAGSEILTMQNQNHTPHIWAMVDSANECVERVFEIFGTGHHIHEDMGVDRKYIGTFQMQGGTLVFHLFERL